MHWSVSGAHTPARTLLLYTHVTNFIIYTICLGVHWSVSSADTHVTTSVIVYTCHELYHVYHLSRCALEFKVQIHMSRTLVSYTHVTNCIVYVIFLGVHWSVSRAHQVSSQQQQSWYKCVCAHCNTPQHTATHCNTLQHTATYYNTLQHTATRCNMLQHTATHCNTLQHILQHNAAHTATHTATHYNTLQHMATHTATHCITLQHTATHCNTLQNTATHCNTLQYTHTTPHGGSSSAGTNVCGTLQHTLQSTLQRTLQHTLQRTLHHTLQLTLQPSSLGKQSTVLQHTL